MLPARWTEPLAAAVLAVIPFAMAQATDAHTKNTLIGCLSAVIGLDVKLPSDTQWSIYTTQWNSRLKYKPVAVAVPRTVKQVSDTVICAARFGVGVQAKGGGHGYGGFAMGGCDGALVVDMQTFTDIEIDPHTGLIKTGAGVRLGDLSLALGNKGEIWGLGYGTCPQVGVAGHALAGGYGLVSRSYGLFLDQLVGLDVVVADGSVLHCSASENTELYWGMRGAGSMFGVTVKFYLQARRDPDRVTFFSFGFGDKINNTTLAIQSMLHLQDLATNKHANAMDDRTTFTIFLADGAFSVTGLFLGNEESFSKTVRAELLRGMPAPSSVDVRQMSFLESQQALAGSSLEVKRPYAAQSNFYANSVSVPEPTGFTEASLKSYFNYIYTFGNNSRSGSPVSWYAIVGLYGGAGSKINSVDKQAPNYASYGHRDTMWMIQHQGIAKDNTAFPPTGVNFICGMSASLTMNLPNTSAYANYVDTQLTRSSALELYFGDAKTAKLRALKKVVDPHNVFRNPHSVEP